MDCLSLGRRCGRLPGKAVPVLYRDYHAILVAGSHGRALLAFILDRGVDALADETGLPDTHLITFDSREDLDRVEGLILTWLENPG